MQRLKITFALNTFYSGPQAWFFLADDLGFFDEEGLEVTFSQGDTAANVVPRLADESLGFDCGFGDINALIEWCAQHGKPCAQVVYALHNTSPYTLAVPAHSAALSVLDLRGQRIASHPNDAALKLLPELALRSGFSASDYRVELCSEPHPIMVRDMVQRQRWDAMFGFVNTLRAAGMEEGIDPEKNLRFFEFRQLLPELYGAGLMVSQRFAAARTEYLPGLVRAVNRGLQACIGNLDAAIDAVARRDPDIDRQANRARLAGTLALEMAHPEGGVHGIGFMDLARIDRAIALIVEAKQYPYRPKPDQIYTDQYLPAQSQRVMSLARPLPRWLSTRFSSTC